MGEKVIIALASSGGGIETIGTVILAIVAIVGLLFAGMGWLYKRGADERELTLSIKQHTEATDNLAKSVDNLSDRHTQLERRVDNHDTRIAVNERDIAANARDISKLWPIATPPAERTRENVTPQSTE